MSRKVKLVCYLVLAIAGLWCGLNFVRAYSKATAPKPAESTTATEPGQPAPPPVKQDRGGMMTYAALLLGVVVCAALLIAFDFSGFFADRFERLVFDEEGEGHRDPEYEEAEKMWANGQPLEAIRLMREFLETHPAEQYAALRIAEIYEKDLGNHLAAALEYEEILKTRLSADRWGRAAIHLANLYSGKLNRPEDATALLRRIINEYPQTPAAKKAREHLGEPEPAAIVQQPEAPAEAPSNLPPGFRPK
ncbi:MAG TPA: tetratricopeptide repeat protein [Candidatus Binatia bacterium]|nr:tetratricopeptide repeat protein [Candidatus Binatia bacterium]